MYNRVQKSLRNYCIITIIHCYYMEKLRTYIITHLIAHVNMMYIQNYTFTKNLDSYLYVRCQEMTDFDVTCSSTQSTQVSWYVHS